jgi:hypothetical protein
MTESMSEPIPKKLRQVKAFAKAMIPLWPSSTWIPEKENSIGEKTRSLKLELSTEPGALMGKNITKSFKIFRSGNPEEWILWRPDFTEVCAGPDAQTGAGCIRMVRQLLSDEPLKEFERMLCQALSRPTAKILSVSELRSNWTADWLRDFMSQTSAGAAADLFWRHAPLLGLQFSSRCPQFCCQQCFQTTAGAAADLFWRHAPLLGLQFDSRCPRFCCQQCFCLWDPLGSHSRVHGGHRKKTDTGAVKKRKTCEEAHSFVIGQGIDDSGLDLAFQVHTTSGRRHFNGFGT